MTSRTTDRFRKAFRRLPSEAQRKARQAFRRWQADPSHPAVRFKPVHPTKPIYSARVGLHWRALGVRAGNQVIWFWIGSHEDYSHLLSTL